MAGMVTREIVPFKCEEWGAAIKATIAGSCPCCGCLPCRQQRAIGLPRCRNRNVGQQNPLARNHQMVSPPHPDETKWVCPVCGAPAGSSGVFVSAWAVACHIAGKTIMGDAEHRVWTKEGPHVVLSKSVPKVAEQIVDRVVVAVRVYNASRLYQIFS